MSAAEFWKYLHDGGIEAIRGSVPGDVVVDISIMYLREQFPGSGDSFTITLFGCSRFEYQAHGQPPCLDLAAIAAASPEIYGLKTADPIEVNCVMGTLRLAYDSASIVLDSGEEIATAQLANACRTYWEEWSKRHQTEA